MPNRLKHLGHHLVVVANKLDVTQGLLDPLELALIHMRLMRDLPLDRIRVCPHEWCDACNCGEPRPGLLIADDGFGPVDFAASWIGGDRASDVTVGHAAGCQSTFTYGGWREEAGQGADFVTESLIAETDAILSEWGD